MTIFALAYVFYVAINAHGEAAGFAGLGFVRLLPLATGGVTLWGIAFLVGMAIVRSLWRHERKPSSQ